MTRKETGKILSVITTAYPNSYKDIDKEAFLNLWQSMFEDYDYMTVATAVKNTIATEKYPPTIATIMEKIRLMNEHDGMNEGEAWALVKKAVSNSLYNSVAEFKKLPVNIQAIVCTPEQLKAWAVLDIDTFDTVIASNFQRTYRAEVKKQTEKRGLENIKIQNTEKLRIE